MRGILFDLDGVLYNSEEPIDGAAKAVAWVQAKGIPHLFVTNTTSRGCAAIVEKLGRFGIHTDQSRILTPCIAAAEWLRARNDGMTALFVDPRARGEFEGVPCLPEESETGARYVVIGDMGDAWDFRTLNRAFRILHSDSETVLIALGMTRFYQAQDGLRLDVAPFIAALEHAAGKKAVVFGKPAVPFFKAAVAKLRLPEHEIAHDRRQHRNRCRRSAGVGTSGHPCPNRQIPAIGSGRRRPPGCGSEFHQGFAGMAGKTFNYGFAWLIRARCRCNRSFRNRYRYRIGFSSRWMSDNR